MNKPLIIYIMSFTRDGTQWQESQYARDTEKEYNDLVKLAEKKIKVDGIKKVKIEKKTVEVVFEIGEED